MKSISSRYEKIKHIYDLAIKDKTSYLVIDHEKLIDNGNCVVTPLDLKYLEDKGFLNIKAESLGEIITQIQIKSNLIEYIEEME